MILHYAFLASRKYLFCFLCTLHELVEGLSNVESCFRGGLFEGKVVFYAEVNDFFF